MIGQYYETNHFIKTADGDSVEVKVGITVNNDNPPTVDDISDLAHEVASELDLTLKGIYEGQV